MGDPTFIGFWPKRRTPRPPWLDAEGVVEICSVSDCVASGPDDWIHAWRHNEWGFYDTPEAAMSMVPASQQPDFDLFGYELFPWRFEGSQRVDQSIEAPQTVPMDDRFESLGYDVVSRSTLSSFFECSPLSCNSWAAEVETNSSCLVDDLDQALHLASIAEDEGCEPGDYYVVRVWRRGRDA